MKRLLSVTATMALIFAGSTSQANTGKEFTTSVIYGTLAGAIVGAATLAFTSNPGDNLNNVARGASYGLYAGILLGIYVSYGVSDNPPPNPDGTQQPGYDNNPPPQRAEPPPPPDQKPSGQSPGQEGSLRLRDQLRPSLALYPVLPSGAQNLRDWGVGIQLVHLQF